MTNTSDRRERYATAIHDAMEPDLSLGDQEPAYQALIARAAEAAEALADAEQNRQFLTTLANLGIATHRLDRIRDAARLHRQQLLGTSELYAVIEADDEPEAAAVSAAVAPPTNQATAEAALAAVETALGDTLLPDAREEALARLMTVLPTADRAATDGPETMLEKRLRHSERRNDELRTECKRRGKRVLEQSERIIALERQVDEVQRQLGAEILRAGQAEAALERIQRVIRRLANHAVGFQDVLDDSDRDPWAKTVGADIAELRRMADETATEHRPAVSRWRVETLDNLANEWAPGTGWPVRALAVERFDAMNAKAPRWKDGTPVTRRLVRETTTYTVEAETGPAVGARQDGAET
jgi:hypothetical protein